MSDVRSTAGREPDDDLRRRLRYAAAEMKWLSRLGLLLGWAFLALGVWAMFCNRSDWC